MELNDDALEKARRGSFDVAKHIGLSAPLRRKGIPLRKRRSHTGGIVDIPFPRSLRDALLKEGLAEEHRWVPNSGWITFHVRRDEDLKHALWLMRLSYLRYRLKTATDPRKLFEEESRKLRLSPQFRSFLERFLPSNTNQLVAEPLAT